MKVGDIVVFESRCWVVHKHDPRRTRTTILLAASGEIRQIPSDSDTQGNARVWCNPFTEWPFLILKEKPSLGRIRKVFRVVGRVEVTLRRYLDWLPNDPLRCGGPLFLSPSLGLRLGEIVVVEHERGRSTGSISRAFLTLNQRKAKMAKPEDPQVTAFSQLMEDDL